MLSALVSLAAGISSPALIAALPATLEPQKAKAPQPPPGLVFIEGGPTKIGVQTKYVEEMAKTSKTLIRNLAPETPQFEQKLDDFFLMVTEVTNEQYAAFVKATGYRPPEHWAAKEIDAASADFVRQQGEERQKAKAEGRPLPEAQKFDRADWWRKNWEGKAWEIPKGKGSHPVTYVDYQDAKAYARWAGLRLMTEFEFQRAGRGRSDSLYPWGNEFDNTRAAVLEYTVDKKQVRLAEPIAVASIPGGATPTGIFDLAGNVWEWTSSPFTPYPGYKDLKVVLGAGSKEDTVEGLTSWDADMRVVVSGCYETSAITARLTTRRKTDRTQSTSGLGFRCAATAAPGLDVAGLLMDDELPVGRRPDTVAFDVKRVLAADKWSSEPGTAKTPSKDGPVAVPNYAVITGYDYVMFVPATEIDAVSVKGLGELSHQHGTIPLGVLSMTRPAVQPALDKGTYVVAFRGAGAPPVQKPVEASGEKGGAEKKGSIEQQEGPKPEVKQEPPAAAEFKAPEGFDFAVDALIFYSPDGEPKGWMSAPNLDYARPVEPKISIGATKRQYTVEKPGGIKDRNEEDSILAALTVNSWVRVSNKGFTFTLPLYFKPGDVGTDWRHP